MIRFVIKIWCGSDALFLPAILSFQADSFEMFKHKLIKRFGNVQGTRKGMAEKPKLKKAIKDAVYMAEIEEAFLLSDHWRLEIQKSD